MQKSGCNNFYMYKYHQKSLFFLKKIAFTLAKLAFSYANSCFYPVFQKVALTFSINHFLAHFLAIMVHKK